MLMTRFGNFLIPLGSKGAGCPDMPQVPRCEFKNAGKVIFTDCVNDVGG